MSSGMRDAYGGRMFGAQKGHVVTPEERTAAGLREVVKAQCWSPISAMFTEDEIARDVLRAVVEYLGLDADMVDTLNYAGNNLVAEETLQGWDNHPYLVGGRQIVRERGETLWGYAERLALFLEAADG